MAARKDSSLMEERSTWLSSWTPPCWGRPGCGEVGIGHLYIYIYLLLAYVIFLLYYNSVVSPKNYGIIIHKKEGIFMRTRSRLISVIICVLIAIPMLSIPAFAYETNGNKIVNPITFIPNSQFGATSKSHMREAVEKWNVAAGSTKMSVSTTTHSQTTGFPRRDDKCYVYRINTGTNDYIAACKSYRNVFGYLYEADININVYYAFANSAQAGCYDLYSVFLHETGHAMGLADLYGSGDTAKVMYGYSSLNTTKRNLTADDRAGIASIYS